jgi:hypothetical protein
MSRKVYQSVAPPSSLKLANAADPDRDPRPGGEGHRHPVKPPFINIRHQNGKEADAVATALKAYKAAQEAVRMYEAAEMTKSHDEEEEGQNADDNNEEIEGRGGGSESVVGGETVMSWRQRIQLTKLGANATNGNAETAENSDNDGDSENSANMDLVESIAKKRRKRHATSIVPRPEVAPISSTALQRQQQQRGRKSRSGSNNNSRAGSRSSSVSSTTRRNRQPMHQNKQTANVNNNDDDYQMDQNLADEEEGEEEEEDHMPVPPRRNIPLNELQQVRRQAQHNVAAAAAVAAGNPQYNIQDDPDWECFMCNSRKYTQSNQSLVPWCYEFGIRMSEKAKNGLETAIAECVEWYETFSRRVALPLGVRLPYMGAEQWRNHWSHHAQMGSAINFEANQRLLILFETLTDHSIHAPLDGNPNSPIITNLPRIETALRVYDRLMRGIRPDIFSRTDGVNMTNIHRESLGDFLYTKMKASNPLIKK